MLSPGRIYNGMYVPEHYCTKKEIKTLSIFKPLPRSNKIQKDLLKISSFTKENGMDIFIILTKYTGKVVKFVVSLYDQNKYISTRNLGRVHP